MAFLAQRRAQQSLAHDDILAFRRILQARHFFGKTKTCSSGNVGNATGGIHQSHHSWCFTVVPITSGVGRGHKHLSRMGLPGAP